MNDQTDTQLLRAYAEQRSEPAFAELVRRHVDLVYSAALRMVCDPHLAQDVTQGVFVALAKSATQLKDRPVLSGWLHRTAQNIAAQTVRTDVRRRAREQEAVVMNELLSAEPDASWEHIAPHLDAALGELSEPDRDALLLRYFERKSARDIAQTLGISDEAAQKRVSRAVERLREFFAKRSVTIGASGLVVAISANAVQAAPAGLALTVSTAAELTGTTLATTASVTTIKTIAMTTLQKTLITATIAAAVGTGIYQARQASTLRTQVHTLQQQQTPLTDQLSELKTENERLSRLVAQAQNSQALPKTQFSELLKLRAKSGVAQADARELAQLKAKLAQQSGQMPDYLTNAMANGLASAEKFRKRGAEARLARMKKMFNLTSEQEQAVKEVMFKHIQSQTQMTMDMMTGKLTPEQRQAQIREAGSEETEIKALLSAEQLAAYPQYLEVEKVTSAANLAKSEASLVANNFSLSTEQQEQVRLSFYKMNLTNFLNQEAVSAANASGNLAEAASLGIELQKSRLDQKIKILEGILSQEQIDTYREEQIKQINLQADAMKMFLPQNTAASAK